MLSFDSFNSESRSVTAKLEIYFNGVSSAPLVVSHDNFLIDFELLEETGAETKNPIGAISANELSFSMYNENNMFSPTNAAGPYAGKIRVNIPVKVYLGVGIEYVLLGTYYVDKWESSLGAYTANVTCSDKLRPLLELPSPVLSINKNESYTAFIKRFFEALGVSQSKVIVDSSLTKVMKYSYSLNDKVAVTLQKIAEAAMCYIYLDRDENIRVVDITTKGAASYTITDANQIKKIKLPQSILKTYSAVNLVYSLPSISQTVKIVDIQNASFPPGINKLQRIKVSNGPVINYSYISVDNTLVSEVVDAHATPWEVSFDTTNSSTAAENGNIAVYGEVIHNNSTAIDLTNNAAVSNIGVKPLKVENMFIQDQTVAAGVANTLLGFISSDSPLLVVDMRGNPFLKLGDIVQIVDSTHGLNYTTKLIRASYRYNGSLKCEATFLNTEVLS